MKVLLDEQVPVPVLEPLRKILTPQHSLDHVQDINWKGKKDLQLLPDAARRGYQVLVTGDANQLSNPEECRAIARCGIHHVVFQQHGRGLEHVASAMATIIAGLPGALGRLEYAPTQLLVTLSLVKPARFQVIDPGKEPPKYWPRRRSRPQPRRSANP